MDYSSLTVGQLRDVLRGVQKRSTAKASRLKRVKGAVIAGSEFDPRVDPERIGKMRRSALVSAIKRNDTFLDRKTQFVGGVRGVPLPAGRWAVYERLQTARVNRELELMKMLDQHPLPSGMLVSQQRAMLRPSVPVMGNPAVNDFDSTPTRKPLNIVDAKGLEKLIALERKWNFFTEREKNRKESTRQFIGMGIASTGELDDVISSLSPRQFETLWKKTRFVTHMSIRYENMLATSKAGKWGFEDEVNDNELQSALALARWAKSLPITG